MEVALMEYVLIGKLSNWREASSDARWHEEKGILSLASNASDGWMTTLTPFSSDQIIRN